jgi:hypothetical protein
MHLALFDQGSSAAVAGPEQYSIYQHAGNHILQQRIMCCCCLTVLLLLLPPHTPAASHSCCCCCSVRPVQRPHPPHVRNRRWRHLPNQQHLTTSRPSLLHCHMCQPAQPCATFTISTSIPQAPSKPCSCSLATTHTAACVSQLHWCCSAARPCTSGQSLLL